MREWVAKELALTPDEVEVFVGYLAGLHDVGKAVPSFQLQDGVDVIAHDTASYLVVPTLLDHPERVDPFTSGVAHRIGEILGGHHGVYQPVDARTVRRPHRDRRLGDQAWAQGRRDLVDAVRGVLKPRLPDVLPSPVAAVLTGLVTLADWIVSDTEWILDSQWDAPTEIPARWEHTLTAATGRVRALGLAHPASAGLDLEAVLAGHSPNALQQSILDDFAPTGAGVLTIATPTGSGKTETAWIAARKLGCATGRHGTVTCLPTQATTNSMWNRTTRTTGDTTTLSHSMAAFHSPYRTYTTHDPDALRWLNGPKRPLLSAHAVVTIDQLLAGFLAARHNAVRQWALTGKTLIIDEVHAFDTYMLGLLGRTLEWCGRLGIPVVLLSATLPGHISRQLTTAYLDGAGHRGTTPSPVAYPGWVWHGIGGDITAPRDRAGIARAHARTARVTVTLYDGRLELAAAAAVREVAVEGGCAAVVCSTVDAAQDVYTSIRDAYPDLSVWLLHSRFPHAQRADIETEIVHRFGRDGDRPDGVVVATSVLEQSLDVDFDLVVSELAPIALLIQRLGRCWRHPHSTRPTWASAPTLRVLDVHGERLPPGPAAIYRDSTDELHNTRAVLASHGTTVRVPDDVSYLVQAVHDLDLPPITEPDSRDKRLAEDQHRTGLADIAAVPSPHRVGALTRLTQPGVDDATVASRLGMDTVRLVPCHTGPDTRRYLDRAHTIPFPDGRPSHRFVAAALDASVTCPASWVRDWDPAPEAWKRTHLADVRLFPSAHHGGLRLDPALGLVKGKQ